MKISGWKLMWLFVTMFALCSLTILLGNHKNAYYKYTSTPKEYDAAYNLSTEETYVNSESGVCSNARVSVSECEHLNQHELVEPKMFPLQFVSGAPGSGNDWILWLASINRYTLPRLEHHRLCEQYGIEREFFNVSWNYTSYTKEEYRLILGTQKIKNCLFLKTHEPWFRKDSIHFESVRAALLLRHPFDAAYSEYKREIVELSAKEDLSKMKLSNKGVTLEKLFDRRTNTTSKYFGRYLQWSIKKWTKHAEYWLKDYRLPLHLLIYNSVKANTSEEIESLQRFFGYQFDGINFRRHCCVMADSFNPILKRQPTEVDLYKEVIYNSSGQVRELFEQNVKYVQQLLDNKYPGGRYMITRG